MKRGTYRERLFKKYIERHWNNVKRFFTYGTLDAFIAVNIETINVCNLKCSYCPISKYPREREVMPVETFYKIVKDLQEIQFKGAIHLHNFGEPLLDERLPFFCRAIHNRLPKCKIVLFTNGTLLTPTKRKQLIKEGVSGFEIVRDGNFEKGYMMFNRGGLIELPHGKPMKKCKVHLDCLIIDVRGNVVLCCNDYFSSVTFGNVNERSVMEIWERPEYRNARREIAKGNMIYDICKKCEYEVV